MLRITFSKGWVKAYKEGKFWERAKPSYVQAQGDERDAEKSEGKKSRKITWDDDFVDEIRRTLKACSLL